MSAVRAKDIIAILGAEATEPTSEAASAYPVVTLRSDPASLQGQELEAAVSFDVLWQRMRLVEAAIGARATGAEVDADLSEMAADLSSTEIDHSLVAMGGLGHFILEDE